MCEISSMRKDFGHSQISNSNVIILRDENIHGFDITMEDFALVNVVQPHTHLKKVLPNSLLWKGPRMHVLAESVIQQQFRKISLITVFHDDV